MVEYNEASMFSTTRKILHLQTQWFQFENLKSSFHGAGYFWYSLYRHMFFHLTYAKRFTFDTHCIYTYSFIELIHHDSFLILTVHVFSRRTYAPKWLVLTSLGLFVMLYCEVSEIPYWWHPKPNRPRVHNVPSQKVNLQYDTKGEKKQAQQGGKVNIKCPEDG